MTGGGKTTSAAARGAVDKLSLQRIRVRADGYDEAGAYWGAGLDVYVATTPDGSTDVTVRAKTAAEARKKAAAELARPPSAPQSAPRERLGGAAPIKSRYEIAWREPVSGSSMRIKITHSRDYLGQGQDHIEVESVNPKMAPLPITETGYRSHFMPALELLNAGGPVTFVTAWLDREAKGKNWEKRQAVRQQGDLFQWAEANTEVGNRKPSVKPKRPAANATQSRQRNRDPK